MNKVPVFLMLVGLILLSAVPASAAPPVPNYFFVDVGGACWLADGEGMPSNAVGANTSFSYEKYRLVIYCAGKLGYGAAVPKEAVKYDYSTTGLVCRGQLKSTSLVTTVYGAVVHPDGWSEITCFFTPGATDP